MNKRWIIGGVAMSLLGASTAWAHPAGPLTGATWTAGFAHPWLGLDHVLVMVAIGFVALRMGGKAAWAVPVAFVSGMALGMSVPTWGAARWSELSVAASVVLCGAMLWFDGWRLPFSLLLAALFGLLHGHVHASEAVAAGGAVQMGWISGVLISTALLHLSGMTAAFALRATRVNWQAWTVRASGAAMALTGLWLLLN